MDRLLGAPAARELVPATPGESGRWHVHGYPGPFCRWNYHPEYEVHLIQRGTGRFIVGSRIGRFSAGQLVLVGSGLPHHWVSDVAPGEFIAERDVVFQFNPRWLLRCQELMPELRAVQPLLVRSARGIEFRGETARAATVELLDIGRHGGLERLGHILKMLHIMSEAPPEESEFLSNPWVPPPDDERTADIVDTVLAYVVSDLSGGVTMAEAARRVGMSESALSRYFSRAVGQSFSDTVRKLRLTQACQLLEHTGESIAGVSRRCGYRNLSNFNRQFRQEYGKTPTEYRRDYRLRQR